MSIEMKNPNGDRCPSYGINGNGQAECYWPECGCYPRPQELRLSWAVVVERQDSLRGPFYTREAAYQVADKVCGNVRELVYGEAPPAAVPVDTHGDEFGRGWNACRAAMLAQQPAALAVPEGYAAAIKAVQEMMPPRDFRPSAQVWLTGNQVNELHARLDAAAMLAAGKGE